MQIPEFGQCCALSAAHSGRRRPRTQCGLAPVPQRFHDRGMSSVDSPGNSIRAGNWVAGLH